MITDEFATSLTPYLLSILSKGELPKTEVSTSQVYAFITQSGMIEEGTEQEDEYVAILSVKGPILKYSQFCGPRGTRSMMNLMEEWKNNPAVVGVLLDIDSGGGQVSGTGEFADFIHTYSKPVVSYTDGMICSAAFYIASGGNEIIANTYSDCIGSIGTMIKYLDLDGVYTKLGAKVIEEYASKSTHKNNAFRKAKEGDTSALIKEELDPINEVFHSNVIRFRPQVKPENLNGHHTSDMNKALELGLIDHIGDKQSAIDRIFELATTNTKKESDMSAEQTNYKAIAAVIGAEEITASKKILTGKTGVFLTTAQLALLETNLEGHSSALATAMQTTEDAVAKVGRLEGQYSGIEKAVGNALKTADLEAGTDLEASIGILGDKVAEYGAQPGATSTKVITGGDRDTSEENQIINANDDHNQFYNSI